MSAKSPATEPRWAGYPDAPPKEAPVSDHLVFWASCMTDAAKQGEPAEFQPEEALGMAEALWYLAEEARRVEEAFSTLLDEIGPLLPPMPSARYRRALEAQTRRSAFTPIAGGAS